jgi:hypothetical protein
MVTMVGALRQALEAARDQIAERLAALDQAEAALAALAAAFGIEARRGRGEARRRAPGTVLPADAAAPAGDGTAGRQTASCEQCGREYEPNPRGGTRQKFCGSACRHAAYVERKAARAEGNGEDLAPIEPWERPMLAPNDGTGRLTAEIEDALRPPALPWERNADA